ncbi:hypothetical protein Ancab_011552, partial [Ancistrocladus abbreviatus]
MKVDAGIKEIEQAYLHETMLAKYTGISLKSKSPLEEQASKLLTPFAFRKFQDEVERATSYWVIDVNGYHYHLKFIKKMVLGLT